MKKEHEQMWADSQPWLYEERWLHISPFGRGVMKPPAFTQSSNVLGPVLFKDARLMWHNVTQPSPSTVCLYWTIEFTFALLPWRPQCVWTGMTRWELNESSGKARQQEDFWDSINLRRGAYRRQLFSGFAAWYDLLGQLSPRPPRPKASKHPSLPYTTLRRAMGYEVRSYDAFSAAQVPYQLWQAGLNVLRRYKDHRNQEKRAVHASLPLLLQLDRQGEGEKTMVLPLRRLSSREQPYSGPDDPDEGAASAMERWVRELPRTGGVLGADARDASETAQEDESLSDGPFPRPLENDYTVIEERPPMLVVVGPLPGEWEDGDVARQRAAALEALATADGLVVSPAYLLVAQYNIGFASSRSTQEVMLVLDDNPWFDDSSSDAARPS